MPRSKVYGEITAEVSFDTSKSDYGVHGSPVWDEIMYETIQLDSLHIFGNEWTEKELRLTFGDQGADAMLQLVFNQIEEWDDE